MNQLLALILAAVLIIFGIGFMNRTQAELEIARARAYRIETEARAEARVTTILAITPMVAISVSGLVIVVIGLAYISRQRSREPKMIERQVVYVLQSGQPRRELWQLMSSNRDVIYLPKENDR